MPLARTSAILLRNHRPTIGLFVLAVAMLPLAWFGGASLAEPLRAPATAQAVDEFDLTAAPVKWEIQPGLVVDGWGYNGQVPGPELRVKEGDLVRVHLHNRLPVPTTIHWHGIDVPNDQDGVPGVTQDAVQPGDDYTYEFTATNPGTRMYHSHVDTNTQLELGLYGAFIVEPKNPEPVKFDREFTYILDEKALDFTPDVALGNAQVRNRDAGNGRGGNFDYDVFMINGKAGDAIPPLRIAVGQKIRLRLINLGNLPHSMHLHGHSFKIIATDGNPVPPAAQLTKDTVLIGPGERYDLEIDGTNPGVWMFHCHMPGHGDNGMMTALVYDGFQLPTGHMPGSSVSHESMPGMDSMPTAPAPAVAPAAPGTAPAAPSADGGVQVSMADDHYVPATMTVPVGTTVTWTNNGLDLHTATSFDGLFDSGTLQPGESFSYTFDQPGEYRYFCRQHLLSGMLGTIDVK